MLIEWKLLTCVIVDEICLIFVQFGFGWFWESVYVSCQFSYDRENWCWQN